MSHMQLRSRSRALTYSPSPTARLPPVRRTKASDSLVRDAAARKLIRGKTRTKRARNDDLSHSQSAKKMMTGDSFCIRVGPQGVNTLLRTGSFVWPHGSRKQIQDRPIPDEIKAYGASLCASKVSRLEYLERLIVERSPYISFSMLPRKEGKVDIEYLEEHDRARLEYRDLLLEIILSTVKARRTAENAASVGMHITKTQPLELEDRIVTPHESFTIYDDDLNTPAMSLYLNTETAAERLGTAIGAHKSAFRGEVALHMKLNNKLSFQGMAFDGVDAQLVFARVSSNSDHLVPHKTDFSSTMYSVTSQRNGFVADMVNLLLSHTDHCQVYTVSLKVRKWDPHRGPLGGIHNY